MSAGLLALLQREHLQISQFIDLLEAEASQMTHGLYSQLSELAREKLTLADAIARTSAAREADQIRLGFGAGKVGGQTAAASSPALQTAWQNLLTAAAHAQHCNYRNGVLIHTQLDFTREALGFLQSRGQSLYGADGAHRAASGPGKALAVG